MDKIFTGLQLIKPQTPSTNFCPPNFILSSTDITYSINGVTGVLGCVPVDNNSNGCPTGTFWVTSYNNDNDGFCHPKCPPCTTYSHRFGCVFNVLPPVCTIDKIAKLDKNTCIWSCQQ